MVYGDALFDAIGVQIVGVLDDFYVIDVLFGLCWDDDGCLLFVVWVLIAKDVMLLLGGCCTLMRWGGDGVWCVIGELLWCDVRYCFEV